MALLRAREVQQLSEVELQEQMEKLRMELVQHYGKVSAGHIGELRRTIARLMTEQNRRRNV